MCIMINSLCKKRVQKERGKEGFLQLPCIDSSNERVQQDKQIRTGFFNNPARENSVFSSQCKRPVTTSARM